MTRNERRWNELQTRWAAGDALTPEEDRARLDFAREDPRAARELEMLQSRAFASTMPPVPITIAPICTPATDPSPTTFGSAVSTTVSTLPGA